MDQEPQSLPLGLDTEVDGSVDFTALSVLPTIHGSSKVAGGRRPPVPVAGSRDWLSSMVEVGRQEAILREVQQCEEMKNVDGVGDDRAAAAAAASDAFFAVDLECVLHKYRRWHECFPRVKPFYAVKCNPNCEVVRALAKTPGCGFDCASPAEMDQVLECGVDPSRIIYANPCKDVAALEHALDAGISTMTFDSKDELQKIRRLLDTRTKVQVPGTGNDNDNDETNVQIVLRLRVPDSHSDCPLGEKYGAAEEACSELIALAVELRLPLVGISFHCGSGCQNAQAYPSALAVARSLFDLAARQGVKLTLLDIGGGFPGWDGSECVYQPMPMPMPRGEAAAGEERGQVALGELAATTTATSSAPSATVQSVLDVDVGIGSTRDRDADSSSGVSSTTAAQADGSAGGGEGDASTPPPPLSLAEIARVTLPVLDELFPPGTGVQVIAEPGRYFVEASHLLFARIYAKRSLTLASQAMGVNAYGQPNGADNTRTEQKTTAYYIDEGVNGCFKDRVLCGVNFEPCPVSLAGGRRHRKPIAAAAAVSGAVESQQDGGWKKDEGNTAAASATAASRERAENDEGGEEAGEGQGEGQGEGDGEGENGEEDAVVMGPSGLPADVVARKRLPKSLKPGDWLFFSQMGAYTASIATVTSSSVLEASYCYVASTPDVGATAASGGCIGSGSLRMGESGARDGCLHGKQ